MRKLTVSSCLILLVFLGSAGESLALPQCPSVGVWDNCVGTWTHEDGSKYDGAWRNNNPHGQGTCTWLDGDNYVGEVRDGKKHGQGIYTYGDGAPVEEGIWENDNFLYAKYLTPTVPEKNPTSTEEELSVSAGQNHEVTQCPVTVSGTIVSAP